MKRRELAVWIIEAIALEAEGTANAKAEIRDYALQVVLRRSKGAIEAGRSEGEERRDKRAGPRRGI